MALNLWCENYLHLHAGCFFCFYLRFYSHFIIISVNKAQKKFFLCMLNRLFFFSVPQNDTLTWRSLPRVRCRSSWKFITNPNPSPLVTLFFKGLLDYSKIIYCIVMMYYFFFFLNKFYFVRNYIIISGKVPLPLCKCIVMMFLFFHTPISRVCGVGYLFRIHCLNYYIPTLLVASSATLLYTYAFH